MKTSGAWQAPLWVGVGRSCQVAYQLRRASLRHAPMPLDWARTPFDGLVSLVRGSFAGFADPENLVLVDGGRPHILDTRYGIMLPHDVDLFRERGPFAVHQRYAARVANWRRAISSERPLVVVRRMIAHPDARILAQAMAAVRQAPTLIVAVRDLDGVDAVAAVREDSEHGRILSFTTPRMHRPWHGCDRTWDRIFRDANRELAGVQRDQLRSRADLLDFGIWGVVLRRVLGADWQRVEARLAEVLPRVWRDEVPIDASLVRALVAAEDRRFFRHRGIDWRALIRAGVGVATNTPLGGGSTIEQQLYRTLSDKRGRSFRRKARELLGAYGLGSVLTKNDVVSAYLLVAYFGAHMTGLEDACGKLGFPPQRATREQAAALIARLKYPESSKNPARQLARIEVRARYILARAKEPCPRTAPP